MNAMTSSAFSAFAGERLLASGPLAEVAIAVKMASGTASTAPVLIFDDATGYSIDLDLRGSHRDIVARLPQPATPAAAAEPEARGRGRPKLGVVAREVTLLPRHWDWLNRQPGGASVALRKLVEDARRVNADRDTVRAAREATYRFMSAIAGHLPGFEEAARALFADERERFDALVAPWPDDVPEHLRTLSAPAWSTP